MNISRLYLLHV